MFRESCNWFLTKVQEMLESKSSDNFLGEKDIQESY